jgi:hypothetical protein
LKYDDEMQVVRRDGVGGCVWSSDGSQC